MKNLSKKNILGTNLIILLMLTSFVAFAKKEGESKQPMVTEVLGKAKVYGDKWPTGKKSTPLHKTLQMDSEKWNEPMVFSGRVTQVCQKMGCWMMLESQGEFAKIDFNNHSFFIPKDTQGSAEVYGVLKQKGLSKAQKDHLIEDGADEVPPKTYEIVATSVKLGS